MTDEPNKRPTTTGKPSTYTDPDNYPAISVHQPYAGLIRLAAMGYVGKDIEVRPMRIRYRGPLVICASKRLDADAYKRVKQQLVGGGFVKLDVFEEACGRELTGKAVALFDLKDCRPMIEDDHEFALTSPAMFEADDNYSWVADKITAIRPFDCTGAQGFFRVSKLVVNGALQDSTTKLQRLNVRAAAKRKLQRQNAPCACGASLPWHLVEFMSGDPRATHVCSCSTTYIVKNNKFVAQGKEANAFADARDCSAGAP